MGDVSTESSQPARSLLPALLLLSCIGVWGVNAVAFKVVTRPPSGFDPLFATGLRFLIVAPCFAAITAIVRPSVLRLAPGDWLRYAGFGFISIAVGETMQPLALRYTSVANMTLLSHGMISLFTALWALAFLKEPISRTGWAGAIIALFGVAIIATHSAGGLRLGSGETWKGDLIAISRSIFHSGYLLMLSYWLRKRPVLQVTVYNCIFGALWMLPYVLWKAPTIAWSRVELPVWESLAWTIVPTTLYGFLAWNWAMRRVGAVAASNLFYLMPVSAALAAYLLLGEPVTIWQILGGAVIIIGIVLLRWDTLVAVGIIRLPEGRLLDFLRRGHQR